MADMCGWNVWISSSDSASLAKIWIINIEVKGHRYSNFALSRNEKINYHNLFTKYRKWPLYNISTLESAE